MVTAPALDVLEVQDGEQLVLWLHSTTQTMQVSVLSAEQAAERIRSAVGRCRPGPDQERPGDAEIARIAWSLRQPGVRDWALLLSLGDEATAAEALWTECARRAPSTRPPSPSPAPAAAAPVAPPPRPRAASPPRPRAASSSRRLGDRHRGPAAPP